MFLVTIYNCLSLFAAIVHWYKKKSIIFIIFYFKPSRNLFSSKCWIYSFVMFLNTMFSCIKIYPQPSRFWSSKKLCEHWKTKPYLGSADHDKRYCDSDINHLDSVNLQQYTTVTNQCEGVSWTWMWHLMYCQLRSHSEKRPGRV